MASATAERNPWRKSHRSDEHVAAGDHELRGRRAGLDGVKPQFKRIVQWNKTANPHVLNLATSAESPILRYLLIEPNWNPGEIT